MSREHRVVCDSCGTAVASGLPTPDGLPEDWTWMEIYGRVGNSIKKIVAADLCSECARTRAEGLPLVKRNAS